MCLCFFFRVLSKNHVFPVGTPGPGPPGKVFLEAEAAPPGEAAGNLGAFREHGFTCGNRVLRDGEAVWTTFRSATASFSVVGAKGNTYCFFSGLAERGKGCG